VREVTLGAHLFSELVVRVLVLRAVPRRLVVRQHLQRDNGLSRRSTTPRWPAALDVNRCWLLDRLLPDSLDLSDERRLEQAGHLVRPKVDVLILETVHVLEHVEVLIDRGVHESLDKVGVAPEHLAHIRIHCVGQWASRAGTSQPISSGGSSPPMPSGSS